MHRSNVFLVICLIFIGGLFLISVFEISPIWGFLFYKNQTELIDYNDTENKTIISGYIIKEPDKRSSNVKLTIKTIGIEHQNKIKKISGKILVTTNRYPEYKYGDKLIITGKLKAPVVFEDFNYPGYLAKDKIYSVMYYPQIEATGNNYGNFFYKTIYSLKNKIKKSVEKIMPLPEVAILEALILGNKKGLTDNLKNQLNISGTRHITAISGMHIIILIKALMTVLIIVGFWRGQAFYFTLAIIALFIVMVGAPASAVRAGIMGGVLIFAEKIGRLNSSDRAVVFVATVMLVLNPLLLKFDVGFQLSFLAVLGIIYLKPIFDKFFNKILPKKFNQWLGQSKFRKETKSIISMTIAAQFGALPILVYNFGRISFISLLANILILPALPYIMGAGFIFAFSSVIWPVLGKILIWPVWFGFFYITKIIELFSKIPFASKQILSLHWIWLIMYYVLLISFLIWYKRKNNNYVNF